MNDFWFYFSKYDRVGEKNKIVQFFGLLFLFWFCFFFFFLNCDKGSSKYRVVYLSDSEIPTLKSYIMFSI